ncbi:hypothetical protein, partial [Caldisericum exile]|uniref:hypothetical protein n=1 Tax=Caldisericum exile TaxID=693075 RepID=UPI003C78E79B
FNLKWAKRNNKISLSYVDVRDQYAVAIGNLSFLKEKVNNNEIFAIKFPEDNLKGFGFTDFSVKEESETPDINETLNLKTQNINVSSKPFQFEFSN